MQSESFIVRRDPPKSKSGLKVLIVGTVVGVCAMTALYSQTPSAPQQGLIFKSQNTQAELAFMQFLAKYGKSYASKDEYPTRFEIFEQNYNMVMDHNAKSDKTFEMGINQFSDLAHHEINFGLNQNMASNVDSEHTLAATKTFPDNVDWSPTKYNYKVLNQQTCGSCWAFSSAATFESALAIKGNYDVSLAPVSMQYLVDCDTYNYGCNGGWMYWAYKYFNLKGYVQTSDYAYDYINAARSCQTPTSAKLKSASTMKPVQYTNLTADSLKYLVQYQPVAIAANFASCVISYKSGVITNTACACSQTDSTLAASVNHAVTLVGYSTTTSISGCSGYWIIKNSWGTTWGESGYLRLCIPTTLSSLPFGTCNIQVYPQIPDVGLIPV